MKLTISSSAMHGAFSLAAKTINSKSALPILDCALISQNSEGEYTLTASDLENTLSIVLYPITVEGDFKPICLPIRTCLDMLSAMPDQPMEFNIDVESLNVQVDYQKGNFTFMAQLPDEFPSTPELSKESLRTTLPGKYLLEGCAKELPFTTNDELRPVMNGIYFDLQPQSLTLAASDGHKLIRRTHADIPCGEKGGFILSAKSAKLLSLLMKKASDVTFISDAQNICMDGSGFVLVCRQIEGRYPNYNSVFPVGNPIELTIDRSQLIGALRRIMVMGNKASSIIRFCLVAGGSAVQLSAQNIDFSTSAEETLEAEHNDPRGMAVGFNGDFLRMLLETATSDKVKLFMKNPAVAMIMTEVDGDETLSMLLMPMMLND